MPEGLFELSLEPQARIRMEHSLNLSRSKRDPESAEKIQGSYLAMNAHINVDVVVSGGRKYSGGSCAKI